MEYLLHIAIITAIYAMLAISLNLLTGYTGLVSLSHAAIFGIGAYAAALMAIRLHASFGVAVMCAAVSGGALGALLSVPALRTRDDYLVIATFAFQVIVFSVLNNSVSLTGGPMGLPGIPQLEVLGWRASNHYRFWIVAMVFLAVVWVVARQLATSPFGRVLRGIREDEVLVQSLGKNIAAFKVSCFVVSAVIAGISGCIYAFHIRFIDPSSFTIMESILVLAMVISGGAGTLLGPLVGAVLLVFTPELLRFVGLPNSIAANVRQIMYGSVLVAMVLFRPQGLAGVYKFGR